MVDAVTAGVPYDEVTAKDHIQVRAKLVRRLGGANQALVWSRIYYRADEEHRSAVEVDGRWWWTVSYPKLGDETGLTAKQALLAVDELLAGGFIERLPKGTSFMYRPVIFKKANLPSGADSESAPQGRSISLAGQVNLPSAAVTPLIDLEDFIDTPVVPKGTAVDAAFVRAWESWIPSRRGSQKKAASSFRTAASTVGVRQLEKLVATIAAHSEAWSSWAPSEHQFVPMMSTWLNQERWTTAVPIRDRGRFAKASTVEHGRQVDDILAAREKKQLAVGS